MRATLLVAGLVGLLSCTAAVLPPSDPPASASSFTGSDRARADGSEDELARTYYRVLLRHTRYQETRWDPEIGSYPIENWDVAGVLGNAVLLTHGRYDARLAGVDRRTLTEHTVASLERAFATNRFVDPEHGTWGARVYWDATMESYLADAAYLMWDRLSDETRRQVRTVVRKEANYLVDAGAEPSDPDREGEMRTNGLRGGHVGDTKTEEMGARTLSLSAADAYLRSDPRRPRWRAWLDRWTSNSTGLPVSDRHNDTVVAGETVRDRNRARNLFDTFTTENHDTWNGMYQQSPSSYAGRNIPRYLLTGQPVPESLRTIPNNDELTEVLNLMGTSAGVPAEHMIADRQHLYGRSVIQLAYRSMVLGDRMAARAETMLADALVPYLRWPPENTLVKSTDEGKYEPEARAEVGYAYLLHFYRDRLAGDVRPVSTARYFERASGVRDFGERPGFAAHQTRRSLAIPSVRDGYVKFAFLPNHDDWFLDPARKSPAFLPSVAAVDSARTTTLSRARDGVDATASVVRRGQRYAGFSTLPDGSVVYATTGTGPDEGAFRLFNETMPPMSGLDGDRTFRTDRGQVTLRPDKLGSGGTETLEFPMSSVRHLRMVGTQAQSDWGYSIHEFEAFAPGDDTNLALGSSARASSSYGRDSTPEKAVDGDPESRWANAERERPTMRAWWSVDLGRVTDVATARIHWQTDAWPLSYRLEGSTDGENWKTLARVPDYTEMHGDWLNVDGRVGFVIDGSSNPIGVAPGAFTLSLGAAENAASMTVRGYPGQSPRQTARAAREAQPVSNHRSVRAALTGPYLSLFNLSDTEARASVDLPSQGSERLLYHGQQVLSRSGSSLGVQLPSESGTVQPPRFALTGVSRPDGLWATVVNSERLVLTGGDADVRIRVRSLATGERRTVTVPRRERVQLRYGGEPVTPTEDLARDRITYPASPLPPGMSDPDRAVDGRSDTSWTPGASNRSLVVRLDRAHSLRAVTPSWSSERVPEHRLEVSDDGRRWRVFRTGDTAAYVRLVVGRWSSRHASVTELVVR